MQQIAKISIKNEVRCTITGLSKADNLFLFEKFGVMVDGAIFSPAYKLGRWDGKIRFFEQTGQTYSRLLDEIIPILAGRGYEFELDDNRVAYEQPVNRATTDMFSHRIGYGGKPLELRQYQVDTINALVNEGSGFAIAGTGAGKCVSGKTPITISVSEKLAEAIEEVKRKTGTATDMEILFEAIQVLEKAVYINDEFYFQREEIKITGPNGEYVPVKALVKKAATGLVIYFESGNTLHCARKHILFDGENSEIFADGLAAGSLVKSIRGFEKVSKVVLLDGIEDYYDFWIDTEDHLYSTADGIVHHNTSITAGLCHLYGECGYKTITIVPSSDLVSQTADAFRMCGMDVGEYAGDKKEVDRLHVVATWQSLQNNPQVMKMFQMVIVDECFAADSLVSTPNGLIKISDLCVGDTVYSMNPDGTFVEDVITKTHRNLSKSASSKMLELEFDNGVKIQVTENHEFYTKNHGKIKAKDLQECHELCEFSDKYLEDYRAQANANQN